jgi:hypothetical protein
MEAFIYCSKSLCQMETLLKCLFISCFNSKSLWWMEAFISCSKSLDGSLFKVFVKEMEALLKCLLKRWKPC